MWANGELADAARHHARWIADEVLAEAWDVAEGEQSRGVGAALLEDAERRARKSGCRHLALLVTSANRRARTFYTRHGYRHVGNLPGFVRPAIGESLYVKSWPTR